MLWHHCELQVYFYRSAWRRPEERAVSQTEGSILCVWAVAGHVSTAAEGRPDPLNTTSTTNSALPLTAAPSWDSRCYSEHLPQHQLIITHTVCPWESYMSLFHSQLKIIFQSNTSETIKPQNLKIHEYKIMFQNNYSKIVVMAWTSNKRKSIIWYRYDIYE